MAKYFIDGREEELKTFVRRISVICMSEEFQVLKKDLEVMYLRCKMDNALMVAFQDALFALLAQDEEPQTLKSQAY
ncbi:MAG: hypothetical protein M0Z31_03985 [Clostridia bacterium]|nr:hypothetical protein [Clostridia bacterium]